MNQKLFIDNALYDLSVRCFQYITGFEDAAANVQNEFDKFHSLFNEQLNKKPNLNKFASTSLCSNTNQFIQHERHVVINDVTAIEDCCFQNDNSISSIEILDPVLSIGQNAFYKCKALRHVKINSSAIIIGQFAFSECELLSTIEIHSSTLEIPKACFKNCKNLLSIHIPDSVSEIEDCAFFGCHKLSSVHISKNVTVIENAAFKECKNLSSIYFPDNENLVCIGLAFKNCVNLSSINIPSSTKFLDAHSFSGCPLREVKVNDQQIIQQHLYALKKYLYFKNIDNTLYD